MVPIDTASGSPRNTGIADALESESSSVRLQAALAADSRPDPGLLETLVERCALEPDFYVRDMLSWAPTRLDIRRRAVLAIAKVWEAPGVTGLLVEALADSDGTVHRHAALALGRRGLPAAVPTLVGMVVERCNDVDAAEVSGASSWGSPRARIGS